MERRELDGLLKAVAAGEMTPEEAAVRLQTAPFSDLGFAKIDHHRGIRQGTSEVIYGAGKTPDQIAAIIADMLSAGQQRILITRLEPEAAKELEQLLSQGLTIAGDASESQQPEAEGQDAACATRQSLGSESGAACGETRESANGADPLRIATASSSDAERVPDLPLFTYYDLPRLATIGEAPEPDGAGTVVVACGGTSDIYVAEEAAVTAEMMGNRVERLYDVGVAGLHRLLAHADELARARVVVAVAGMEGALPSVIGGLVSCPVIAVPTSVGYGASLEGVAALLAMLNSCASGVSVVNIDNGFGAGYQASLINHI